MHTGYSELQMNVIKSYERMSVQAIQTRSTYWDCVIDLLIFCLLLFDFDFYFDARILIEFVPKMTVSISLSFDAMRAQLYRTNLPSKSAK